MNLLHKEWIKIKNEKLQKINKNEIIPHNLKNWMKIHSVHVYFKKKIEFIFNHLIKSISIKLRVVENDRSSFSKEPYNFSKKDRKKEIYIKKMPCRMIQKNHSK